MNNATMNAGGDTISKSACMWEPKEGVITNIHKYMSRINEKHNLNLSCYKELYEWSCEHYSEFWEELWDYAEIKSSQPFEEVVDKSKGIADIPEWFRGSRLNYAENLLKYRDDHIAIYAALEGQAEVRHVTYAQLYDDVARYAAAMRAMGVTVGDRVVGYISNNIEAIAAMLATASIGAIWSSTSPDFGVTGVLERFSQIQPKLLFSVHAVQYNGKRYNHIEKLSGVVQGLPDLQKVVVMSVTQDEKSPDLSTIRNSCTLDEFLSTGKTNSDSAAPLVFEQLPFNHPLFIMYSSGTTGAPKCMVHSAGGTLIKHLEEHLLQGNMTREDKMLYYTTTGWMMWNWMVGSLGVGATVVCYDGSPLVPNPNILWDLIDKFGITVLGTGAKWLMVLEERGVRPRQTHSLTSLHSILSTGSPLKPQSFDYVYNDIKPDVLLGSITGGTDIIACFAGQNWTVPVYRGEIQSRHLGMAVHSWSEHGKAVYGDSGELVCTKPFPSMPTHFWSDPDGGKYRRAYFDKFAGVWAHGDFCMISAETGGIWMLGRSDGTLNPNGVRYGSAEIYQIVEAFKEITDSLCVAQRSSDGTEERVVLFLKMAPGSEFGEELVKRVRTNIRLQLSARHVPAFILETQDIPYTHSGKKVEVAVKRILGGEDVTARGAYANPDSLDLYYNRPVLKDY